MAVGADALHRLGAVVVVDITADGIRSPRGDRRQAR
jgi:hypothetical protein